MVAARGRSVMGDHGFRAASARIEAVALPARVRARPRAAERARGMLAARYPQTAVYRSRRRMLREHPPHDLRALGITARPTAARRYKRAALCVWVLGVAACYSVALVPREAVRGAGPAVWLGALGGFLLWQALLVWLVARCSTPPRPSASR